MKKVFNLSLLMAALVMIGLASCKPNEPKKVAVTGVTVNPTKLELKVGATSKITATVAPNDATNKKVTWASSDAKVATVDASGNVKAVAVGTADITVTTEDGKKTATCKVTVSDEGGPGGKEALDFFDLSYLKLEGDVHAYIINLATKGSVNDGKFVKAGTMYRFVLISNAPADPNNPKPAVGTYMGKDDMSAMSLVLAENVSFYYDFDEQGQPTSNSNTLASGTFVVEANKLSFVGKDVNGKDVDVYYEGEYKAANPWQKEPSTPETMEESFDTGKITDYKDAFQSGTKDLYLFSYIEGKRFIVADFFINLSSTTFTPGTYNVADTKAENTILKSKGWPSNAKIWELSSVAGYANSQGQITKPFFFDNGTATVTANKIEFNVKSHFGSTLKLTYTGDMTLHEPPQNAPAYLKSTRGLKVKEIANNSADLIKAIR